VALVDPRPLAFHLLRRNDALLRQRNVALEVHLGIVETGLVASHDALFLVDGCLQGPRVELHQQRALLD